MKMESIVSQPVIETERFILRPVRASDAGLLQMYAGDERVSRFTRSIPHPLPPGAVEAFIDRCRIDGRKADVWIMDGSSHGLSEVLGVISLEHMERGQSQIGYWVAPAMWNTGLASEAVNALLDANPQEITTVFAEVFQDNPGSARVLTNAGFEYLGDAEAFSVSRGAKVNTWTYLKKLA